jgi:squalene-hopene/tetraprenyl-beta-curcumene cyclase
MALKALNNPAYAGPIEKAKNYLLKAQKPPEDSNPNSGGVGYGSTFGNPDGGNTAQWIEALKEAGVDENSPAFKNAQEFFTRLQNNPETNNKLVPEGVEVGDDGGFVYKPGEGKGRDAEGKEIKFEVNRNGKRVPKSYGMMSYAGLKSFIYMHVDKSDPRVQSAWKWVRDNYTLEENKNIGADGLYYTYLTMAKALAAYGEPVIETADGKKHEWARELSQKLLNLQRPDGSWSNDKSSRWMESDRVMVTAFAIRALAVCRDFYTAHPAGGVKKEAAPEKK